MRSVQEPPTGLRACLPCHQAGLVAVIAFPTRQHDSIDRDAPSAFPPVAVLARAPSIGWPGLFMPVTELSVVTYNIHKGFSSLNGRFVLPRMRTALAESGADIVFLQEALGEHQRHATRHAAWPDDSQF